MKKNTYINDARIDSHCHIFSLKTILPEFLKIKRIKLPSKIKKYIDGKVDDIDMNSVQEFTNNIPFFKGVENLKHFLYMGLQPEEKILKHLDDTYKRFEKNNSANYIFAPLMMDVLYGFHRKPYSDDKIAVELNEWFFKQIQTLKELKAKPEYKNRIYPFLAVDPRRPNIMELVERYVIKEKIFHGIKIYPPLGYLPTHPKLMKIFDCCSNNHIPVITHCNKSPCVTYKLFPTYEWCESYNNGKCGKIKKKRMFYPFPFQINKRSRFFAHPKHWATVLKNFPKLRLNLAHFGGLEGIQQYTKNKYDTKSWTYKIIDLMKKYENVYTDVAFIFHDTNLFPFLNDMLDNKDINNKILYGSDFSLTIMAENSFDNYVVPFYDNNYLDDDKFNKISRINPRKFLKIPMHSSKECATPSFNSPCVIPPPL